ncbi:MAG: transcription elongation factor GreA [Actinomycetota bacterium]|nr:transcription elongation factor GreA [Actinomycetota bacterium]
MLAPAAVDRGKAAAPTLCTGIPATERTAGAIAKGAWMHSSSATTSPMTTTSAPEGGTVVLGSRIRVRDSEGEYEHTVVARATVDAPPGCVSVDSPVGRALLGCGPGDQVQVQTPGGIRHLTVLNTAPPLPSPPRSARTCVG